MVDQTSFLQELREAVRGEVLADEVSRGIYSTDASHYQVMPACVVVPHDRQDVVHAIRCAARHGVPLTSRGAGTSLSGQTTWSGLVLDLSKYMDQLLELNVSERWVRVEPGVISDRLNQQLARHGLHFAPDPATGSRANVGGMIGNNSSGMHSVVYGKTIDHVLACTVVLADGSLVELGPTDDAERQRLIASGDRAGKLWEGFAPIFEAHREEIYRRFPKVMRRVSGYNLDAYLPVNQGGQPGPWNLTSLIVGSEGTLGVVVEAKLRLEPLPAATALCIVHFHDLIESLRAVAPMLEHRPSAVELLDHLVLDEAQRNRTTRELADFLEGAPQAIQVVELSGDSRDEVTGRAEQLAADLKSKGMGYSWPIRTEPAGIQRVWEVRKLGLGLISNLPGRRKGQAFIEDACVPVAVLPEYIEQVLGICAAHDVPVTLYAHASVGVLHVRPMLDLHDPDDVGLMKRIADEVFELVVSYGGSFASEHGDGILRGEFIPRFYGPEIYDAFRAVKQLFDPQGLMNPGKIVDPVPMTSHLRYGPHYRPDPPASRFQYQDHGGFVLAVEKCNGVGACRKLESGTMCPSYMATRDEHHTTRGRANALRMAMSEQLGPEALTGDDVHAALDLCLACKACKSECPNSVDMSRMKADVLQWRYRRHGVPWGAKLIAELPDLLRYAVGPGAGLANWIQRRKFVRHCLAKLTGIDARRPLPTIARESLVHWYRRRQQPATDGRPPVLMFCDTFTNFMEPHVGQAAVRLLEHCGYHVDLADVGCCQRPAISKGMLDRAQRRGATTMQRLAARSRARDYQSIVILEPSCASSLIEDLPDLLNNGQPATLEVPLQMIDTFLAEALAENRISTTWSSRFDGVLLHGHCHQKALFGTAAMKQVFDRLPGLRYREVDAGCCGMAGSFGYDHYELSQQIGEDRLFPAVRTRETGTEVVACGISCRHQLYDFLNVRARHWVEVFETG